MGRTAAYRAAGMLVLACGVLAGTASDTVIAQARPQNSDGLDVVKVRDNVFMIAGAGGNITAHVGPAGVIVVDSGSGAMSDRVLAAISRLSEHPIRYIINTSAHRDHVGGNEVLSKAGQTILGLPGSSGVSEAVYTNNGAASVLAHENVMTRMSRAGTSFPQSTWPTKVYTGKGYSMYLNGDGIQVLHVPAAHSDGDSIVFFRRADVIVTGALYDTERFPVIDVEKGGSIQGVIEGLNRLLEITIPPFPLAWQPDRTLIVPGHGFVSDYGDVQEYRNMVTVVRDRIQDMVVKKMTLAQVKAADPTKGFRVRYGSDSGPWTTDMFVEAVYTGLTKR